MAVSGAGGWVPSFGVYIRNGQLCATPTTQNKPPEMVISDMAEALQRVLAGESVQIDVRNMNFVRLRDLYEERR